MWLQINIWPICFLQSDGFLKDNSNAAQRLLDGVNLVAQSVSELSVKPAKAVTSWLTDQIAPAYWKPNSLILVSDTHSPIQCHQLPTAKSTLSCPGGDVYCLWCVPVTQSMIKRRFALRRHPLSSWSIQHELLLFFSRTRCAISVTQSSRITTLSITAVPVGRASVMAALPKRRLSLREAGVLPLSECVMSALSRELHMQVHTLYIMSDLLCFSWTSV